jgi:hypothetical protein
MAILATAYQSPITSTAVVAECPMSQAGHTPTAITQRAGHQITGIHVLDSDHFLFDNFTELPFSELFIRRF